MAIGLGILGFAHGHVGMYCARWAEMPAMRLVAGWDHDAARAKASAETHGMAIEASAASLLKRADVDAVVIAAETSMHADLVEQAAAAGKAIVLQKPLCLTLAEADRIVAAVEQSGVPFTLAWQMRVDPQNLKMRQLVKSGALGRIYMLRRRHGLATHLWPDFEKSWHVKPELNRGMWADDAAHPIDFAYWMLGMPQTVSAEIATLRTPKVPDDNGIAIFRYADGTMVEIACSFTCVAARTRRRSWASAAW
jgi:predicted dehydrogenase